MKKPINIVLAVVGVIFLGLAVYYWVTPAGSLPTAMPGYEAGSSHVHIKHGLAAFILAIGAAVVIWFNSGSKASAKSIDKPDESNDSTTSTPSAPAV